MMNDKEVAFILCTNNELYTEECIRYIQELNVPEGYTIDVITIGDAVSMACGYNAGMQSSNAKYKVYLHQDLFIINRDFISDVLSIFNMDSAIGMIGMVGGMRFPKDARCFDKWSVGKVKINDEVDVIELSFSQKQPYTVVADIDGMIMITSCDIPWREDILDGWDFYDIAQAIEMQEAGYKVVVPYQAEAWCYHDCGASNLSQYDYYRKIMLAEYTDVFSEQLDEQYVLEQLEISREFKTTIDAMIRAIELGQTQELVKMQESINEIDISNKVFKKIKNLITIFRLESENIYDVHTEWYYLNKWDDIIEFYNWVRLVLIRMNQGREDERIEILKQMVREKKVSYDAIRVLAATIFEEDSSKYLEFLECRTEMPLVSIVMPVYNGADFVAETIESILAQTYKNFELIIVDDASKDNTKEVIEAYKDERIRTIFLENNVHICRASNIGFKEVKGKYVALIGHDDMWKCDKLEKQVTFLEEHPQYGACFTHTKTVDEYGNTTSDGMDKLFKQKNRNKDAMYKALLNGNFLCAPSACVRRDVLEQVGYYRYALVQLQDYDLWLRVVLQTDIYIMQEALTLYRRFTSIGKNLSSSTIETNNRDAHERQWIIDKSIHSLTNEQFIRIFREYLRNKEAFTEMEVACEKAFLLWDMGICFAEKDFIELLEEEEVRDLLERQYNFRLQDFYKMNTENMSFEY